MYRHWHVHVHVQCICIAVIDMCMVFLFFMSCRFDGHSLRGSIVMLVKSTSSMASSKFVYQYMYHVHTFVQVQCT